MKKQQQSHRDRNTLMTALMALGISWSGVQPSWAEPGALTQLPAPDGCIAEVGNGIDCTDGFGLAGAIDVTVSPDGKHAYVASYESDAIVVFARNKPTGVLTQLPGLDGCIANAGDGVTCTDGVGLDGAAAVTVSPDGKHVYVASWFGNSITAFARNKPTGVLTQLPGLDGCIANAGDGVTCTDGVGLHATADVTVSPDGKHVYVASTFSNTVAVFARNQTTGVLTQLAAPDGCIAEIGDGVTCTDGIGLDGTRSVTVSKDGKHVYVASRLSDAVAIFTRTKTTGVLTQLPAPNGCISQTGDGVTCIDGVGLDGASSVTVSKDGKHAYVASAFSDAVAVFARTKTTGVLTQLSNPHGCIAETGNGVTCIDGVGLDEATAVTVSPDGKHVYVASFQSDAITVFAREQE